MSFTTCQISQLRNLSIRHFQAFKLSFNHTYYFIPSQCEIHNYFICSQLLNRVGRRIPLSIFHLIGGAALICTVFQNFGTILISFQLPHLVAILPSLYPFHEQLWYLIFTDVYGPHLQPLVITLSMIGKFAITMSFSTVYVFIPEIYPTNVR